MQLSLLFLDGMSCSSCGDDAQGTVTVPVCGADCAQHIGARIKAGSEKTLEPGLWVQGKKPNQWRRPTSLEKALYADAVRIGGDGNYTTEMVPLSSELIKRKNKADIQVSVMRQAGSYYLYKTPGGMNRGPNLISAKKYLFWMQPEPVRPPLHGGGGVLVLPGKPRK